MHKNILPVMRTNTKHPKDQQHRHECRRTHAFHTRSLSLKQPVQLPWTTLPYFLPPCPALLNYPSISQPLSLKNPVQLHWTTLPYFLPPCPALLNHPSTSQPSLSDTPSSFPGLPCHIFPPHCHLVQLCRTSFPCPNPCLSCPFHLFCPSHHHRCYPVSSVRSTPHDLCHSLTHSPPPSRFILARFSCNRRNELSASFLALDPRAGPGCRGVGVSIPP